MRSLSLRSRKREASSTTLVASREVNGSSAITSAGRQARACAMTTLCRSPPLNWCGYASYMRGVAGRPTRPNSDSRPSWRPLMLYSI